MKSDDRYTDRTPDLVAKIRKLREEAERKMDRFTRLDDYDVRRVIGQKPKASTASEDAASSSPAAEPANKSARKPAATQLVMELSPAPAERDDDDEEDPDAD
jgi:hypothetical protein